MSNLPFGTTQDMIDAQCATMSRNLELCAGCCDVFPTSLMYPWQVNTFDGRGTRDVYVCEACKPTCQWILHNPDRKPCGRIQSPNAQGPWCAEHEKEAEALDSQESEECND